MYVCMYVSVYSRLAEWQVGHAKLLSSLLFVTVAGLILNFTHRDQNALLLFVLVTLVIQVE